MVEHREEFINFAVADRNAEARSGFERRDADIMKSVYSTLFLDHQKLRNFLIFVKNVANGRCLEDMFIFPLMRTCVYGICSYICVRLLRLLVLRRWAKRRPLMVWTGR